MSTNVYTYSHNSQDIDLKTVLSPIDVYNVTFTWEINTRICKEIERCNRELL